MEMLLTYLRTMIDESAEIEVWNAKAVLDLQLACSYRYYLISLLEQKFLLMQPLESQTIEKIKLHMNRVSEKADMQVAVFLQEITPYRRKRMLAERIPFIVSEKQMYLPFLALHIREFQEKERKKKAVRKFTPSTQLLYLFLLYQEQEWYGIEELEKKLEISAMTVVRAVEELESLGLINSETGGKTGRKKIIKPIEKRRYYHIGKKYLQNPIKKVVFIRELSLDIKFLKSGLTALGEQTMLGEPDQEIYAIDYREEKEFEHLEMPEEQAVEEMLPCIQLMKYNVNLLTNGRYIDPVTMILTLEEKDERIELAIEELMEEEEWYEE